ncbi:MAG: rRNA methylase, putative, group 3 [Clostridia bacterium]|jgi:23S rRNA (guanosine2251-2'-O)-methyltransferase|nr:rRNA methylase, putative, group 3 [Clostridia bacterium]
MIWIRLIFTHNIIYSFFSYYFISVEKWSFKLMDNKDTDSKINPLKEGFSDTENIVFGRNPVAEALKSGRTIDKIFITKGLHEGSIIKIIAIAKEKGIPIIEVDRNKLENITKTSSHQGILAFVTDYVYNSLEDIIAYAKEKGEPPFILILDGINDPHNLGAVIRTANACGVHGIVLPKRNSCGLTATVFKAAAGAVEYVKIARVVNITATLEFLKENNIWTYGADGSATEDIYHTDMKGAVAIILGDEGHGISRLVKEHCDFLVKIPMKGEISSLNVSVAGAVIMYEVIRQRGG